jgi:hypothetical protein
MDYILNAEVKVAEYKICKFIVIVEYSYPCIYLSLHASLSKTHKCARAEILHRVVSCTHHINSHCRTRRNDLYS